MALIQRGLILMATAGALALPAHFPAPVDPGVGAPAKKAASSEAAFTPSQIEYFLGDGGIAYIRPGLNIKIAGVTNVASGQKPVIEFFLTDDLGQPLDITGGQTPGVITYRFIPAVWNAAARSYQNLFISGGNPSRDTTGPIQTLELGHYKYTFSAALVTFDASKPMTMFMGGKRTLTPIIGKDYWAQAFYDFVPSTGALTTAVWQATKLAKCNACHDPLAPHGGNYRDIKTCALCHNPINMTGTNAPFNGQAWFHSIHTSNSSVGEITYPQDIRNCVNCHDATAGGGNTWYTFPSRAACGACHTTVNFTTGAGHGPAASPVPPQLNDSDCATCHQPQGDMEFDASIKGAHTIPLKSKQLKGLVATIVSVSNFAADKAPTVVFKITNTDGTAVDGSKLAAFAPMFAGPTFSYTTYVRESAVGKAIFDAAAGTSTYTFTAKIPKTATKTWAVSVDIERAYSLVRGDGKTGQPEQTGNESPLNPFKYYSLDGSAVENRRTSVTMAQCNQCHDRLALHGGQRLVIEECVMCHNPTKGDEDRRGTANPPVESVSMQRLIHRIHTGEEMSQDYTVIGFGGSVNNFNDVTYPGDRRNCVKCHTTTGFLIPLADERGSEIGDVKTLRDYFSPQGPETAACVGCHDRRDNLAHAYLNTSPFGEACSSCHGVGLEFGVDKVHAR